MPPQCGPILLGEISNKIPYNQKTKTNNQNPENPKSKREHYRDNSKPKRDYQNPNDATSRINKSEIPCIYNQRGRCKWGRKCYYKHATPSQQPTKTPMRREDIPCRYYAKGFCIWENECKYKHADRKEKSTHNENKQEICIRYTKGRCNLGNFCKFRHHDQTDKTKPETPTGPINEQVKRCKRFDEGYCPNKPCQFTHMKNRVETYTPRNDSTIHRCKDFDNGFCPRKTTCTMPHKKDRTQEKSTTKSN